MAVIPLTLTISLCLVATFVLFFLRESAHRAFSSAEHDSLLPLADEMATTRDSRARETSAAHASGGGCGCASGGSQSEAHSPCAACRRARVRTASTSAAATASARS
ncbi:MAG: hypothetical protein JNJ82_04265 [Opitutaceae bacterium]|nr:hypothetical protein [Opitutaceae bacterium]